MFSKQKQIILNSEIAHSNSNFLSAVNSHETNHMCTSNFIGTSLQRITARRLHEVKLVLVLLPDMHHHPSLIHLCCSKYYCICEQGDKLFFVLLCFMLQVSVI